MTPRQFVAKWTRLQGKLNEVASAQSHFNDLCDMVGHPQPYSDNAPEPDDFRFEKSADKPDGNKGFADVYLRGKFVWEYKGAHGNLDKAYEQVKRYASALGNPPLLIVSDMETIRIHTGFINTLSETHILTPEDLLTEDGFATIQAVFAHPDEIEARFKPTRTQAMITEATAAIFVDVVDQLKAYDKESTPAEQFAHFMARILFCLFADDMDLLPNKLFKTIVSATYASGTQLETALRQLFQLMREGGQQLHFVVPHFNGELFDDAFVPPLPMDITETLLEAARQDWSGIEPSIFGTLFERVIDSGKRAQLGAHYTSYEDIMLIVNPVLMEPLRREWEDEIRPEATRTVNRKNDPDTAHHLLTQFAQKIASTTVLDPACGSGNFLYVALRQLLDLQKEVIVTAERLQLPAIPLTVSPAQLYGIEINPFAHELAQITVWIGSIQWRKANGFSIDSEPILQPLNQIEYRDSVLTYVDGSPTKPIWPSTTAIIGNPPFIGEKKMRSELGDDYVDDLRKVYEDVLSGSVDYVCYWFECARTHLVNNEAERVGLIATQGIRAGTNRDVLDKINASLNLFFAYSDRDWILDGATVHISVVGFSNKNTPNKFLDGQKVVKINSNLTSTIDVTQAQSLSDMRGLAFQGPGKVGKFDISDSVAKPMLEVPENATVIKRYLTGRDLLGRDRNHWLIDFGLRSEDEAQKFVLPFDYVQNHVKSFREQNRDTQRRKKWWRLGRSGEAYKDAVLSLERQIFTSQVAKYRIFVWVKSGFMPANTVIAIARKDDYFFGVLHSAVHLAWADAQSSQLRESESGTRYTPTTTFETFPFPWVSGGEPSEEDARVFAIADAARELVTFRQAWLNPPDKEIGVTISEKVLKKRTLTNMYNALTHYREARQTNQHTTPDFKSTWAKMVKSDLTIDETATLHDIHTELDRAVLRAYGWPTDLTDEQILERLLALNLERAAAENSQ